VTKKCISACTVAFLGGRHRTVSTAARLGFHIPQFGGDVASLTGNELQDEAISGGVSADFAKRAFTGTELWYPSARELKAAGVATEIMKS